MSSTRLKGKVFKEIRGQKIIDRIVSRVKASLATSEVIVATTTNPADDTLYKHLRDTNIKVFRGSEKNVLERFYFCAKLENAEIVVRITADCPFIDPTLIDVAIKKVKAEGYEYASNVIKPTFPDGLDVEAFSFKSLESAYKNASSDYDKEHVTPYIIKNSKNKFSIENSIDLSNRRWTVDDTEDLNFIISLDKQIINLKDYSWKNILNTENLNGKEIYKRKKISARNEGSTMSEGQKLWQRAKELIPGGNMLLSKRPEMFLPNYWPAYYQKTKGCHVWDLEGKKYTDISLMGVGTNLLGYSHDEVDKEVIRVVTDGNMSTLNCPEEVYLAEKLVELHPWADMVKLARSGGEANAIAIRIARAATGKDGVAICGYHGWHDWYLSVNLTGKNALKDHLLPGLDPNGVPKDLLGSVHPFPYNDLDALINIVNNNDIAAIKMEVSRNEGPRNGFLEKIRKIADEKGIVLIFDECTSGFRETYGGLHKKFGVNPDMAVFGKAMGNGYAITAVIGKKDIMEAAQSTFISSTFWTERIGPAAAVKTLEIMQRERSWEIVTDNGHFLKKKWKELAQKNGIQISCWGIPALAGFTVNEGMPLESKTFITKDMLAKGWLASNAVYGTLAHTRPIIEDYLTDLDDTFYKLRHEISSGTLHETLENNICHSGFKRLN